MNDNNTQSFFFRTFVDKLYLDDMLKNGVPLNDILDSVDNVKLNNVYYDKLSVL